MWKQEKFEAQIQALNLIKNYVTVSGGMAWHLMSPPHKETKYIHDHKDLDLFVNPKDTGIVIATLKQNGFNRYWTKYDGKTPDFIRYGKSELLKEKRVKVLIDLFSKIVPYIEIKGYRITKPEYLLSLYGGIHTSHKCVAVRAASILIARGINPVNRNELVNES